ncbi:MAG: FtsX-like permease family protein [Pseudomonadota bacterium]
MRLPDDPDGVVPPTGLATWLTAFVAGAMAVLAVFAVLLTFATGRMADRWTADLSETSTLRVPNEGTARTLDILRQTPGVAEARALTDAEQADLLEPWLGAGLPLDELPVPRLIEITEDASGFDAEGLRLRLEAEVPGAILDDHTRWRQALVSTAGRVRLVGWVALGLIVLCLAAMVTLAARAALASSERVISVLRLVGARDTYVVRAFTRRFTLRAVAGALCGTLAGAAVVALLPADVPGSPVAGLRLQGIEWLTLVLIPLVTGAIAFAATRQAAYRALGEVR